MNLVFRFQSVYFIIASQKHFLSKRSDNNQTSNDGLCISFISVANKSNNGINIRFQA